MISLPFLLRCLAGFIASLALASAAFADSSKRPNIIVTFTNDQSYAHLACQGRLDDLRAPHLDKLAANGLQCILGEA